MSDALGAMPPDPDSDGCLCVVASFFSAARTINEVTAEAAKRTMMSPVLSDFIEFRFADLGPQPEQGGDRSAAIRRITDALLNPQGIAGRNYFALVVVDRSAAVIDQMLSDCATSPFLDKLRMRSLGIANSDDRPNRGQAREPHSSPEIVTSPRGVWSRKDDLVDVLRRFVGELQRDFSAQHKPGLSIDELGDLRERYHEHKTQQAARAGASPTADTAPDRTRMLDVLAGDPQAAQAAETQDPETQDPETQDPETQDPETPAAETQATETRAAGSQQAQAPQDPLGPQAQPAPNAPQPSQHGQPDGQGAEQDASASEPEPAGAPESAGLAARARRWIPELRWRRGQPPEAGELQGSAEDAAPKTEGVVYLLVVGDESCRDETALNRSRSALLEVDKKIAELPGFAYQVRMLHGDEDGLRGDLREAGQLGRRDIRRTVASVDFAAVLETVRTSLKRDRASLKAADATTWPAVVFFTPEPPLADTVAAELFRDLAREASIVWALPKSAKALLSETFTHAPGVRVIVNDQAVADEIAALLSSSADSVKADA